MIEAIDIEDVLNHRGQDHESVGGIEIDLVKIERGAGEIEIDMMIGGTAAVVVIVVETEIEDIEIVVMKGRGLDLEKIEDEVTGGTIEVHEAVEIEIKGMLITDNVNVIMMSKKERKVTRKAMMSIEK